MKGLPEDAAVWREELADSEESMKPINDPAAVASFFARMGR